VRHLLAAPLVARGFDWPLPLTGPVAGAAGPDSPGCLTQLGLASSPVASWHWCCCRETSARRPAGAGWPGLTLALANTLAAWAPTGCSLVVPSHRGGRSAAWPATSGSRRPDQALRARWPLSCSSARRLAPPACRDSTPLSHLEWPCPPCSIQWRANRARLLAATNAAHGRTGTPREGPSAPAAGQRLGEPRPGRSRR